MFQRNKACMAIICNDSDNCIWSWTAKNERDDQIREMSKNTVPLNTSKMIGLHRRRKINIQLIRIPVLNFDQMILLLINHSLTTKYSFDPVRLKYRPLISNCTLQVIEDAFEMTISLMRSRYTS